MEIDDPQIIVLRQQVKAAQEEFNMAVMFHEVWKPAAYDNDLHGRMGKSFASQAFLVIRMGLRREMLLALMRLWDNNKQSIRVKSIKPILQEPAVIDALALDRVNKLGWPEDFDEMRDDLRERATEVIQLINKYTEGGSHASVLDNLMKLRHERLAHRQLAPTIVAGESATDKEIEDFYKDNAKMIKILCGLVNGLGYDPEDLTKIYGRYAKQFWASARGERTEGHPNYVQRQGG